MADTHVTITGNLTDDPELRFTPNGNPVANFRLAVTARIKDGDNWRDGDTSYFRINVWRQLAEHVAESLSKGDRAVVIGRLKSRSWETPEGDKRSVVEVEADEVAPSLHWAIAKPEQAPTARARASSTTSPTSEPPARVRPRRPPSRPRAPRTPEEVSRMHRQPYPTHQHPEPALHLLGGI